MTAADLALLAALCTSPECLTACVSPLEPEPKLNITFALPSPCVYRAPPLVEVAAAVPMRVKRKSIRKVKLADRCGSMTAYWYVRKDGRKKYRCR